MTSHPNALSYSCYSSICIGQPEEQQMKVVTVPFSPAIHGANVRLASVVSKAKLARWRANSFNRASMIFPAASATRSGSNADRPCATTSALTNSVTPSVPFKSTGAVVDFPAPFGPARITTLGARLAIRCLRKRVQFAIQNPKSKIQNRITGTRRISNPDPSPPSSRQPSRPATCAGR